MDSLIINPRLSVYTIFSLELTDLQLISLFFTFRYFVVFITVTVLNDSADKIFL